MKLLRNNFQLLMKNLVVGVLIVFSFASCKKDKDTSPSIPIEGVYTGKYGLDNDTPDTDQKYNIKAGGIFQEIGVNSGAVVGEGTWQLNGNNFTATYTIVWAPFSKYSVSATFDPATGKLTGTWGYDNSPSDGGKIDMTRL
jgi:hypothetical protein